MVLFWSGVFWAKVLQNSKTFVGTWFHCDSFENVPSRKVVFKQDGTRNDDG